MADDESARNNIANPSMTSVIIKAAWFDQYAKHWYEYPRRFKNDSAAIPSICLRGRWLADAGFSVGQTVDVEVSAQGILLKIRPSA